MNILVVGGGSWDDTTSLGNTFSNIFSGWKDVILHNLYFRETAPNNSVCKDYFRITTKEILMKYWTPQKIGMAFQTTGECSKREDRNGAKEKKAISMIHRFGLNAIYELEDQLWYSRKWINEELDRFIDRVNPDIIFSFAAGNSYMWLPIEYIKMRTGAKLVLLVADDLHTTYRLNNDRHHMRMRKDLDQLMGLADRVYGISEEMCAYYQKLYGIVATPLYKGCLFENRPISQVHTPIKIVYAGNLLFGRLETLIVLVDCLERLNTDGVRATLDVYSGTIITEEEEKRINRGFSARFHGEITYQEVKQKMAEADVVLHVESFEDEQIKRVRYSFSTKIIDCLQSGSVMLAIGPKGISSIEYPRKIPGAVVIDDLQEIYDQVYELVSEGKRLVDRAGQIRTYALDRHDIVQVRKELQKDFHSICGAG